MSKAKLGVALVAGMGMVLLGAGGRPTAEVVPPPAEGPQAAAVGAKVAVSDTRDVTPVNTGAKVGTTVVEASAPRGGPCAAGMVEVEGDYCPNLEQKCLRWVDPDTKMRCAEFAPTGACQGKTQKRHFCIDQYEYPNKAGEKPLIMKSWYEARDACKAQGKRLCGDSEWTLACEGQERLPYPYGYARNADACNIDKPHPDPDQAAIANPKTREAEVARLDQRDASGARESCVSPYGVHDMTGNVDEWVVNEGGAPYKSGLKGGYWGPVRTRCRPMTTAHNEDFAFYQIGFRCCADAAATGAGQVAAPAEEHRGGERGVSAGPAAVGHVPGS